MQTRLLSEAEFKRTFGDMKQAGPDHEPVVEFWSYFDAIPADHFQLYDCSAGRVDNVHYDQAGAFEHVLVNSETPNVFMTIVIDLVLRRVHGHYLLNLNHEYGLETPSA